MNSMKELKGLSSPIIFLGLILIITIVVGYFKFEEQKNMQDEYVDALTVIHKEAEDNKKSIDELSAILSVFIEGNEDLAEQLILEQERRFELETIAEENKSAFTEQILSLQNEVDSQNLTPLISNWSQRVGRLKCTFNLGDKIGETNSSAVVTVDSGRLFFVTNDHAVTYKDKHATGCDVTMLDGTEYEVDGGDISRSQSSDLASLKTDVFDNSFSKLPKCEQSRVETGDRVVILGYPSVGSEETITATEGIVSGFDDGHYITSAKIERGNSGGAAVHVKDDCFLGLPTLVYVGSVESLARILPI